MAKASATPTEEPATEGGVKKKRRGLLIALIGAPLLLAAGGIAAWLLMSGPDEPPGPARAKPVAQVPPVFFTLEPFVVNLAGDVETYLQVGIDLKVADSKVSDKIKTYLPEIRNGVLLLLSSKNAEDIVTLEGKNQLRREIRAAVNAPLGIQTPVAPAASDRPGAADRQGVLDVLLTSFVIQ